jgi:hypothetical protein
MYGSTSSPTEALDDLRLDLIWCGETWQQARSTSSQAMVDVKPGFCR